VRPDGQGQVCVVTGKVRPRAIDETGTGKTVLVGAGARRAQRDEMQCPKCNTENGEGAKFDMEAQSMTILSAR